MRIGGTARRAPQRLELAVQARVREGGRLSLLVHAGELLARSRQCVELLLRDGQIVLGLRERLCALPRFALGFVELTPQPLALLLRA